MSFHHNKKKLIVQLVGHSGSQMAQATTNKKVFTHEGDLDGSIYEVLTRRTAGANSFVLSSRDLKFLREHAGGEDAIASLLLIHEDYGEEKNTYVEALFAACFAPAKVQIMFYD